MTVRLPSGKTFDDGPFPTLVEYSGYQVAAPHDLLSTIVDNRPDPLAPASSTAVGSLIAPLLGFAVVSVQMRGSGCSGGAFGLFDLPTTYDGYDAIETVAAQDWVKGGKVGMAGISFSGITPALHGRHAPAAPRRDQPDVGHRRPLQRHREPRRDPELRLRAHVDPGADGRRGARAAGRPALRPRAREAGRPPLPPQPAPAPPDPGRDRADRADPAARPADLRRPLAREVDGPHPRPDVPRRLLPGRADQRPLRREPRAPPQQPAHVVHAPERRPRRLADAERDHPLGRVPQALRRRRGALGPRQRPRPERPALPLPRRRARVARRAVALRRRHRRRRRPRDLRARSARAPADGERRRPRRASARSARRGSSASVPGRSPRRSRPTSSSAPAVRSRPRRPPRAPPSTSPTPPPVPPPRCPARATRTPGRPSRPTTGSRSRTARASASPPRRCRTTP